jgi:hypothetical protein
MVGQASSLSGLGRMGILPLIPVGRASSPSIKWDRQDACRTKIMGLRAIPRVARDIATKSSSFSRLFLRIPIDVITGLRNYQIFDLNRSITTYQFEFCGPGFPACHGKSHKRQDVHLSRVNDPFPAVVAASIAA